MVFVFPGQGSQWVGMGAELLAASPVFAEEIERCAAALAPYVPWSLVDVLRGASDAPGLDRDEVVQPALWAVMVALARLWQSCGVEPAAVVGHSQGEIAAACVAGALSLEDGAKVVALRSRMLARLAGQGGLLTVAEPEELVRERLSRWDGRCSLAAVNGPAAVVVAGDRQSLDELTAECEAEGVRTRRVSVDYASHSPYVEQLEDPLTTALAGISPGRGTIPFYSTVTGAELGTTELDHHYWYRNLRRPVLFASTIRGLLEAGHTAFVEVSPHPVLTVSMEDTLAAAGVDGVVTGSLRRTDGGLKRFLLSAAGLHVAGMAVDWNITGHQVELPTYAFQRERYWLPESRPLMDATALGQDTADHPLLGAVVEVPETGGVLCTSRLSLRTHSWLADHAVDGVILVPGTGVVELAIRAGDEVGCTVLDELVIEAPLVIPEQGGVRVQVAVGGPNATGLRTVSVYSAREDTASGMGTDTWTRHATGTLSRETAATGTFDFTAWPPPGTQQVDICDCYEKLTRAGYEYGPAFQCVRKVWRRGDELFAEVAVPQEQRENAAGFGIHPALLDAALHASLLDAAAEMTDAAVAEEEPVVRLPFTWNGLTLHASGAASIRVRLLLSGPDTLSLVEAVDEAGGLVLTLDSLVSRAISAEQLAAAGTPGADALFRVEWSELHSVSGARAEATVTVVDARTGGGGDTPVALAGWVLEAVQAWLASGEAGKGRLLVVTRGAVPAGGDATVTDPGGAAVWGLVRAAQAENPDRIVLVDTDTDEADPCSVLAAGEPQVAMRGTTLYVPRLARVAPDGVAERVLDPDGTVLITGGTGSLGGLLARHLVARHGIRHLVLVSRRGLEADGARELVAELKALGAEAVCVPACDVTDRHAVAALLGGLTGPRLTAVVHAAGVLDAGTVGELDAERLARVFAPKVTAVQHLDELTRVLAPDLDAFVTYSSVSGVFLGAGTGSYGAANACMDGLVAARRAAGFPAQSLAWGLWEQTTGMGAGLDDLSRGRMNRRGGVLPLGPEEGMDLFDAALGSDQTLLVPVRLDLPGLRADAAAGAVVPPLLHGLVHTGRRAAAGVEASGRDMATRLALVSEADRDRALLDLVRVQVAAVLGHPTTERVELDKAFSQLGFDSLTSVELRNRLSTALGLRLPATLVFDHPSSAALATYLGSRLASSENQGADTVDTLSGLLREASGKGRVDEGLALLVAAAKLRESFVSVDELDQVPQPVRLASGPANVQLFCFNSPVALGGSTQFARLADHFDGVCDLYAMPVPGFARDERLPATTEAAVSLWADNVRQTAVEDRPVVLLGYSAGGSLAHATTVRLEEHGFRPAGLVLLDTLPPDSEAMDAVWPQIVEGILAREATLGPFTSARLSALGRYSELVAATEPVAVRAPVLFLRPDTPLAPTEGPWRGSWHTKHDLDEVEGNHFTMLEEHAPATARAVQRWLTSLS